MEQCVLFLAVGITLILALILYSSHKVRQARANFRLSVSGTKGVSYPTLQQVRDHPLTWVRTKPNKYALGANSDVLAVLYLDDEGTLIGAKSAGGPWAVEGDGPFSTAFSLRQVQSQIDVVRFRFSSKTIKFPTGRAFRCKRESGGILGIFGAKPKWVIFDDSRAPLISIEENSRIVKIEQRAYSMSELPFLVLLGGYLMISETEYGSDDSPGD